MNLALEGLALLLHFFHVSEDSLQSEAVSSLVVHEGEVLVVEAQARRLSEESTRVTLVDRRRSSRVRPLKLVDGERFLSVQMVRLVWAIRLGIIGR